MQLLRHIGSEKPVDRPGRAVWPFTLRLSARGIEQDRSVDPAASDGLKVFPSLVELVFRPSPTSVVFEFQLPRVVPFANEHAGLVSQSTNTVEPHSQEGFG